MRGLVLAVALAGCGGGGTTGGDLGAAPDLAMAGDLAIAPDLAPAFTFAEFKPKVSASICKFLYGCCKPAERMGLGVAVGTSEAECEAMFFDAIFQGCSADVAASRASFDPAAGQACLDLFANATCGAGINQFNGTACDNNAMGMTLFKSNQTVGMACACSAALSYGCKSGYCKNMSCTAYLAKDADCVDGICDPATLFCDGTKCAPILATGADCTGVPQGCDLTKDYCDTMNSNTCKPQLADGADCSTTGSSSCKSFHCDMNTGKCATEPVPNICTGM